MENNQDNIKFESISGSVVKTDPITCPDCGSTSVQVSGSVRRAYIKEYNEGNEIPNSLELGEELFYDILILSCKQCQKNYKLEDDEIYKRDNLIYDLQARIAFLSGNLGQMNNLIN